MKKYILTESQIRNLVNNVVDEGRKGETKYPPEYLEKIKEKYKGKPLNDFKTGEDRGAYDYVYKTDYYQDFIKDMIKANNGFPPEYLEKIKEKYKGKFLSDFINGEDRSVYSYVYRQGSNFYQDFIKDMIKKQDDCPDYTKKEIKDIAKTCKTKTEFLKKYYCAWKAAINLGPFITNSDGKIFNTREFYNSITSHIQYYNLSKRLVYSFEFYDENNKPAGVYVGLTYDSEKRKGVHETGINYVGEEEKTAVTKFMKDHPTFTYVYKEKTDYIEANEAKEMEKHIEREYFTKGWNVLNIAPTGGLGGIGKSLKQIKKELDYVYNVVGIKTLKDLQNSKEYIKLYAWAQYWGLHDPKSEDFLLGKFERKNDYRKTDDEVMDDVKKYNSYDDFFNDKTLVNKIDRRKLLKKVKEYFNLPPDKPYIKKRKDNTIDAGVEQQNKPIEQN
jgi:hypothetical protein